MQGVSNANLTQRVTCGSVQFPSLCAVSRVYTEIARKSIAQEWSRRIIDRAADLGLFGTDGLQPQDDILANPVVAVGVVAAP